MVFIEGEVLYGRKGPVPEEEYTIPLGRGEVKKEGEDVTLVAWSKMLYGVLTAADERRLTGWTRSGAGNGRGCAHALCQEP